MESDTVQRQWLIQNELIDQKHFLELSEKLLPIYMELLEQENIDDTPCSQLDNVYLPLAIWLAKKHSKAPIVIGISGAQGSGKSTLSKILKKLLTCGFGKSVAHLSLDDLYLSKKARVELAKEIHPFFKVRGVPGTHNVNLGLKILSALVGNEPVSTVKVPVFDKSLDDLLPESEWVSVKCPVDIVLFEGWCVNSRAQSQNDLAVDVNKLEASEDPQGLWRQYVNDMLGGPYQKLFDFIDYQLMLKVPEMDSVFKWRCLQEKKLREKTGANVMSDSEIERFIMFFERITRENLKEMPRRSDIVLELDTYHQVSGVRFST